MIFRLLCSLALGSVALRLTAADAAVRAVEPTTRKVLVPAAAQPVEYRYLAFPSLLATGPDEVWICYKAGRSHATDPGAALEVIRHTLSTGKTERIARLPAPPPKLYQMGELVRLPDGTIAIYVDVQAIGWDNRHYRAGAEVIRWNEARQAFDAPAALAPINGVQYGYPFDFISEGRTTWQLIMAFGYMQGGRWSVDVLRSEDSGGAWQFVRNLTAEFGGIRANETGFVRHGDGFIVTTRAYDSIERLHRTDRDFRVLHQADLTGKAPFVNSIIGRPRLLIREGQGYVLGRNWTRPNRSPAERGAEANPMELCLIRFNPETLVADACVVLDNADRQRVTDGYYAVTAFSGTGAATMLHVFTYKAVNGQPPDIVRFDYRWDDVK